MKKIYTFGLIAFLFSSCGVTMNYLGNTLPETRKIEIFVDQAAIKKSYTVIGKAYVDYAPWIRKGIEKTQKKAIQKAKEHGADAILFEDYYLVRDDNSIRTTTAIDTVTRGLIKTSHTSMGPVISSGRNILFLKYNE